MNVTRTRANKKLVTLVTYEVYIKCLIKNKDNMMTLWWRTSEASRDHHHHHLEFIISISLHFHHKYCILSHKLVWKLLTAFCKKRQSVFLINYHIGRKIDFLGAANAQIAPLISIGNHSKQSVLLTTWDHIGRQPHIRQEKPMRTFQFQDLQTI